MNDRNHSFKRSRTPQYPLIAVLAVILFVTPGLGQTFPDVCMTASQTVNGITIEIPCVLKASYPFEVKITGQIQPYHQIRTVPAGKGQNARATNPSSLHNVKGGETSVALHAPYPAGDYELLYLSPGRRSILLSVPFRVVAPKAEIFAPDTAEANTTIEVRVVGDISPNTKINIVPVGSATTLVGDHAYLSADVNPGEIPIKDGDDRITGSDPLPRSDRMWQPSQPEYGSLTRTVIVPLRKAKPGKYEIQYVTLTSHVVYARKPLTIN